MARTRSTPEPKSPVKAKAPAPSKDADFKVPEVKIDRFAFWLIGSTPLIVHAWSEKAKGSMLNKQTKKVSEGQAARNPEQDFLDSLYAVKRGNHTLYGFPVTAVKKALLSVAHKDRGVPRETVRGALWLHHKMVRVGPALAGAVCDLPLVRVWGSDPEMREDMVRVGSGLNKTATLAYRAQFTTWALRIKGTLNTSVCPLGWLPFLATHAGRATGIGDWRNEKNGMFGAFRVALPDEAEAWDRFARGTGPLPKVTPDDDEDDDFAEAAE